MLASLPRELLRSVLLTVVIFVVTGLVYPFVITGVSQVVFNSQANGSLIARNGQVIGSQLIGQEFTDPRYFFGRPSATLNLAGTKAQNYNAENSTGSNLAPSNQALIDRVAAAVAQIRTQDGLGPNSRVPIDLVTTDFSGFDPDISEAAALLQVNRVAAARSLDPARLRALVEHLVQGPSLGIFGESHVNVLQLNMTLDNGEAG